MEKAVIETFTHIMNNWVDYLNLFFNLVLAFGVWIAWKSYKAHIKLAKIDKAIQLTEYYKNHILPLYQVTCYIYEYSGISKIIKDNDNKSIYDFDMAEFNDIFNPNQIESINNIIDSDKFCDAAYGAYKIFGLDIHEIECPDLKLKKKFVANEVKDKIIIEMLNSLEHFAMYFSQNVADEDAIFNSIHQTYFDIVKLSYYQIVKTNEKVIFSCDRYYTKTIKLYQIWKDKYEKKKNEKIISKIDVGSKCN